MTASTGYAVDGTVAYPTSTSQRIRLTKDKAKWAAPARFFSGRVESTDIAGRSAVVSGFAEPGSDILLNGRIETHADDSTGEWSTTVDNLQLGKNTITAEEYIGEDLKQSITIDAELKVTPLAATIAWDAKDARDKAVVSGTAEKGANIVAKNGRGEIIGSATATNGTFSFGVDAPNMGGETVISVAQTLDGDGIDSKQLTFTYGKAVAIATPANDSEHAGGELKITGTGEAKASVSVREKGASSDLLPATTSNIGGGWSLSPELDAGEHTLEVVQTGKGNNVTTDTVVVNPGKESVSNGGFTAAGVGTATTIKQGAKADAYVGLKADGTVTKMDGTELTLDAPTGTTFTAGQKSLAGQSRTSDTGSWTTDSGLTITGEVENNGKQFVGKMVDTGSGFSLGKDAGLRWKSNLTAAQDAPVATADLGFTVTGSTNHGAFSTEGKSPVTIENGAVAAPTGSVSFDADVTKQATVSGTGVDGGTITLYEGTKKIGDATVANGTWSTPISALGAGSHTIRIEQTGVDGTQTASTVANYGDAVSMAVPTTFSDGKMTVTGKSSLGAIVTIATGGKQVDSFTVTNTDGTFSRNLSGLGSGQIDLTAVAKSKGALSTTATQASSSPITAESVQISSHVKDGTFVVGDQTFTGRGTVGATITFNVHGFAPANAGYNQTATVNQWGEWTIKRGLADTTYPLLSVKQTAQAGVTNILTNWNLRPYKQIGAPGDLQLTNFKDGDFFNPGDQTFTGKATPGAKIVFNPFGLDDPTVAQYDIVTTADPTTGDWTIRRALANAPYDRIAIRQEPAATGLVNQINRIGIAPNGYLGAPADLKVATPSAGSTVTAGTQHFTGTARIGTTVTLYVWGDNPTNAFTAKVDARGRWSIDRPMGAMATPYNVKVVQSDPAGKIDTVRVPLTVQ